jgi:group I intron endonuclease
MTCGIYKITSPSGKVYIGQSVDIEKRFYDYMRYTSCHRQRRLYSSLKSYGAKSHVFEIVETCDAGELLARERHWQDVFDATGKRGLNCRLTTADDRAGRLSPETVELLRQKNAGANNPNYGKRAGETSCFGRARPEQERAAIRAFQATRGRIIEQVDPQTGAVLREARCRDYAAEGLSQGNISSCCTGRLKTYKGFLFRYKEIACSI